MLDELDAYGMPVADSSEAVLFCAAAPLIGRSFTVKI